MTDLKHANPNHLRLVESQADESPDNPLPTQQELVDAIRERGLLPAALDLLCEVLPEAKALKNHLPHALEEALRQGTLKLVYVHGTPHVASPGVVTAAERPQTGTASDALPAPEQPPTQAPIEPSPPVHHKEALTAAEEDQQRFQLAVMLDAAYEKALLFRVLIVLNVVGSMLLLREILQ